MKKLGSWPRRRCLVITLAFACLWLAPPCLAQETPLQAAQHLEDEANAIRQQAAAAHERAQAAEDLAKQARDQAAKTTDPVAQSVWKNTITEREETAQHLKQQADELDQDIAKKTAEAERLRAQASNPPSPTGAPPSSNPMPPSGTPAPPPPIATGNAPGTPPAPASPAPSPAAANPGNCNESAASEPLSLDQIAGVWTAETDGSTITVSPKTPNDTTNLVLEAKHHWEGTIQGGRLKFTRKPTESEMGAAPPWATAVVAGKLEWTIELDGKIKCGQPVLEGRWLPGEIKFHSETDVDGKILKQEASLNGPGTPIALKYLRETPAIADTVSVDDQTRISASGRPWWPYPFQPGAQPQDDRPRTLLVVGRGLPHDFSKKIQIESADPTVGYRPIAFGKQADLTPMQQEHFSTGWKEVMKDLDGPTQDIANQLDAMLIRVDLGGPVVPGLKQFTVNGIHASWRLRFGDDRAIIGFARPITTGHEELTDTLFLPERFYVEVRTRTDFSSLDGIPLKLQLEKQAIVWGGKPTLVARRDPVQRTVYRTDLIELIEKGRSKPAPERGVYYLPGKPTDHIYARLEDPFLLEGEPPVAEATIFRSPSDAGKTWKDALTQAAKVDGKGGLSDWGQRADWGQLSGAQASEFANISLSSIFGPGAVRLKIPIFVGDHAALLLLRDSFVQLMERAQKTLPDIKDEVVLRGLRESLKPYVWSDDTKWSYLKITCPDGGECPFFYAVRDDYRAEKFGEDKKKAADEWSLQAMAEGVANYQKAVHYAIEKAKPVDDGSLAGKGKRWLKSFAKGHPILGPAADELIDGTDDDDIDGLLRLVGFSYEPMLAATVTRLMKLKDVGSPPRQLWVPDLNARATLTHIKYVAMAVRDQQDYSKLDTQFVLLEVSALAAPFMLGEGVLATAVVAATDTSFFGIAMAGQVPDYFQQEADIHFALGASLILGTQRLSELELKKTQWYEVLLNVGTSAAGAALSTGRMVGAIRTSLILSKLEAGGLEAYKTLKIGDQDAFWRYVTEAKLLEEEGEAKAITRTHERASEAADRLIEEMKVEIKAAAEAEPKIEVEGEPGPREETVEVEKAPDEIEGTLKFGEDEEIAPAKKPVREREGEVIFNDKTTKGRPDFYGPGVIVYEGKPRPFKFLKKGGYAYVYELADRDIKGCANGCVLKIYGGDDWFGKGTEILKNTRDGAELVGADIPQMKNLYYSTDTPLAFLVQEKLGPDTLKFDLHLKDAAGNVMRDPVTKKKIVNPKLIEFLDQPGASEAAVDLIYKIKEKNLAWEDAHIGNMYFFKDPNTKQWVAGLFDTDRIIKWDAQRSGGSMQAWFGYIEAQLMLEDQQVLSLYHSDLNRFHGALSEAKEYFGKNPGPYFPNAEFFAEKIFEWKGWIKFDPKTRRFVKGLIDPAVIQKRFPHLFDPDRLKELPLSRQNQEMANPALDDIFIDDVIPLDLDDPYWKSSSILLETLPCGRAPAAMLANLGHPDFAMRAAA